MFLPDQNKLPARIRNVIQRRLEDLESAAMDRRGDCLSLLADLKETALEAARLSGCAVLSADGRQPSPPAGQGMKKLIYFSVTADSVVVRRHLGVGGTAVFIREDQVLAATGGRAKLIATINSNDGFSPEQFQLEDALAAAAGFLALGIQPWELWPENGPRDAMMTDNTTLGI